MAGRGALRHTLFSDSTGSGGHEGYGGTDSVTRSGGARARDCSDLLAEGHTRSGVYTFTPSSLHRASYGHDYYTRRVRRSPA